MKVGLLLGTFDPPHIGHLYLAIQALNLKQVDEVWVTPAWKSPWKPNATNYEIRFQMCSELVKDCSNVRASALDWVVKSEYTYEFLKFLKKAHPENEYIIISGSDIDFSKWKEGEWIKNNFKTFVVSRDELVCSSTEIRNSIKSGLNPIPFINPSIFDIIKQKKLYR